MSNLLILVFLVLVAVLLIGLFRPKSLQVVFKGRATRKYIASFLSITLLIVFVAIGIISPQPQLNSLKKLNSPAAISPLVNTPPHSATPKATAINTDQTMTATQSVAFTSTTEQNPSLAQGKTVIKTVGVNGVQTQTYDVSYSNGVETGRVLVATTVTTQPITQVTEIGTYVTPVAVVKPTPVVTVPTPTPSPAPAPVAAQPASCYPLTNSGKCYEPGEFCRTTDAGLSGIAGDSESIICENNNGLRWEPN